MNLALTLIINSCCPSNYPNPPFPRYSCDPQPCVQCSSHTLFFFTPYSPPAAGFLSHSSQGQQPFSLNLSCAPLSHPSYGTSPFYICAHANPSRYTNHILILAPAVSLIHISNFALTLTISYSKSESIAVAVFLILELILPTQPYPNCNNTDILTLVRKHPLPPTLTMLVTLVQPNRSAPLPLIPSLHTATTALSISTAAQT